MEGQFAVLNGVDFVAYCRDIGEWWCVAVVNIGGVTYAVMNLPFPWVRLEQPSPPEGSSRRQRGCSVPESEGHKGPTAKRGLMP